MADDFEDSSQGYDPEAAPQQAPQYQEQDSGYGGGDANAGDSAAADMPLPDDEASKPAVRNWVRELLDYTRSAFGMNEEAVPSGGSPAGPPQQAPDETPPDEHEPAGPPVQAGAEEALPTGDDTASFDRKTGTAGGVRERPRAPAQYDQPAESARAAGNVQAAGEAVTGAAKHLFSPDEPPPSDAMKKIKDYVMGMGAEDPAQRDQREAQTAAGLPPGTTKSEIRDESLKRAAAQSPQAGSSALQGYRQLQTSFRGKAAAALDHNDVDTATKLWNEAHTYVPDGTHATAVQTPNGVTMVMTRPDGVQVTTPLTQDQFRELLHKRAGEFDHLAESGIEANVRQLARTPGMPPPGQGQDLTMTKGIGGPSAPTVPPMGGKPVKYGSLMSPAQRAQNGFGDVQPSDSQGRSKEAQAAQGLIPRTDDMAKPPPGRPAAGDMSPEARASRMTQWASQNRPGQRERLTEGLRQSDVRETTARTAAENKNNNASRGLDIRQQESERKDRYGNQNLDIKREAIAQRDRHLGYLVDKSTGELNEKTLSRLSRETNSDVGNVVRYIDSKIRSGTPLEPKEQQYINALRERATRSARP